ncbi:early boundary activity protein 1 [Drosophila elegans]|uniref:early boundary activity protein 1 n=1 Tax=Drosophila elegans TaxID=30023 RepID=UPI0007E81ED1|nr:early boundary activity protein 1 [Drosophila elegans]
MMPLQINRRQRLEFALTLLPYDPETVQLSEKQKKVEQIIARLRTDHSFSEEESDDGKMRRLQEANEFADSAMRHIEMSDTGKLSTLETLTLAAEKLLRSQRSEDFEDIVQDVENAQLMRSTILAVNEARMKLIQQWERSKRKALDLLTIEIEKVQEMDQEQEQAHEKDREQEQDQDQEQSSEPFDVFRNGTDEHNTSTPKTNDGEIGLDDDDDEDYVPAGEEPVTNKRKRIKKPVTSTPNAKRPCPGFEFDQDSESPMVMIGPNGTEVSRVSLSAINWDMTGPSITRKLLCEIFDRDTLAHHTLSGKPSPAFRDCARPSKQQLDPLKVADLVYLMTNSLDMTPREVRTAITTKCADENKMLRSRLQRRSK